MANQIALYEVDVKKAAPRATGEMGWLLGSALQTELLGMTHLAAMTVPLQNERALKQLSDANDKRLRAERLMIYADKNIVEAGPCAHLQILQRYFHNHLSKQDLFSCRLINHVVLSSLLIALYGRVVATADGEIRQMAEANLKLEEQQSDACVQQLAGQFARDENKLTQKTKRIHFECMSTVSEAMTNKACVGGPSKNLAGSVYPIYLRMLEEVGIPSELSLSWMAALLQK